MAVKTKKKTKSANAISPYQILNRWLYDGNKNSKIPKELEDTKAIPQTQLIYHFINTPYIVYLSKVFNNFGLYQLNKLDVFKLMKETIQISGYRPPFIPRKNPEKNKMLKVLKMKFPFMKMYEIDLLITQIDKSEYKDSIYESFGFYKPKKQKTTKVEKKKLLESQPDIIEQYSYEQLMENFTSE